MKARTVFSETEHVLESGDSALNSVGNPGGIGSK